MTDPFEHRSSNLNGPARDILPVVPSDTINLPSVALALYVETAGDITFITQAGQVRTLSVADFSILPVGTRRVNATGTTASGIHAFVVRT
jgi:hypothetical protein